MSDFTDKLRKAAERPANWNVPGLLNDAAKMIEDADAKLALWDELRAACVKMERIHGLEEVKWRDGKPVLVPCPCDGCKLSRLVLAKCNAITGDAP